MRDLLQQQYGKDACHVKAFEDIYLNRETSKAIEICMPIGAEISEKDHQTQVWQKVSESLSNQFQETGKTIEDLPWKVVVESNISIPTILDRLYDRLKLAGIATGKALQDIVTWVKKKIAYVWDYITSFFQNGEDENNAVTQSEEETKGLFAIMADYFNTSFFESVAHKVMNGLLLVVDKIRTFLYQVGRTMTHFVYGSMESIYNAVPDGTDIKRKIVKTTFYMMSFINNVSKFAGKETFIVEKMLQSFADKIIDTIKMIVGYLGENAVKLTGWIFDSITQTVEWIVQYLPWLTKLIDALKTVAVSLFGSLQLLAPFFETTFGSMMSGVMQTLDSAPAADEIENIRKTKEKTQELLKNPNLSEEVKEVLNQSVNIAETVEADIEGSNQFWKNEMYKNSAKYDDDVAELFTQCFEALDNGKKQYVDDDETNTLELVDETDTKIDTDLFLKVLKAKTGFAPLELQNYLSIVNEYSTSVLLKAELETKYSLQQKLEALIGGNLTEDEEKDLAYYMSKVRKGQPLSKSELGDARALLRQKEGSNMFSEDDGIYGTFNETFTAEQELMRNDFKNRSVEQLKQRMSAVEDDIIKKMKNIIEFENLQDFSRTEDIQEGLLAFLRYREQNQGRDFEYALDAEVRDVTTEAYMVLKANEQQNAYITKWAKLMKKVDEYNIIRSALNLKKKSISKQKGLWIMITGVVAFAADVFIYFKILQSIQTVSGPNVQDYIPPPKPTPPSAGMFAAGVAPNSGASIKTITDTILRAPLPADVYDIHKLIGYAGEAFTTFNPLNAVKYIQLITMVMNLIPAASAIYLSSWFFLTTIVFFIIEQRDPNYHSDGYFMWKAASNIGSSVSAAFFTFMYQAFIIWGLAQSNSYNTWIKYGSMFLAATQGLSSFNFLGLVTGFAGLGKNVFKYEQEQFLKAINTRWNIKDYLLSQRLKNVIFPINMSDETRGLKMQTYLEVLSITDMSRFGKKIISKDTAVIAGVGRQRKNAEEEDDRLDAEKRERQRNERNARLAGGRRQDLLLVAPPPKPSNRNKKPIKRR